MRVQAPRSNFRTLQRGAEAQARICRTTSSRKILTFLSRQETSFPPLELIDTPGKQLMTTCLRKHRNRSPKRPVASNLTSAALSKRMKSVTLPVSSVVKRTSLQRIKILTRFPTLMNIKKTILPQEYSVLVSLTTPRMKRR